MIKANIAANANLQAYIILAEVMISSAISTWAASNTRRGSKRPYARRAQERADAATSMVSATAEVGEEVELRLNFSELSSFQSHGQSFALISLAWQVGGDAAWSLERAASYRVARYHSLCRISYVIITASLPFHVGKKRKKY
jgi:hypothetical protein